jgi:heterodisulfide reductase subunit A
MEAIRIGVFICHCGTNIAGFIDVKSLVDYVKSLPNVVFSQGSLYTCSQAGLSNIKEAISEYALNRVVVASCSPRTHEQLFRATCEEAGLNPYLFHFVNIREQCSWVHMNEREKATVKAKDLIRMGVARASLLEPGEETELEVLPSALVLGGGIAGMTCALDLANRGFDVHLVEKEERLGGKLNNLYKLFPMNEDASIVISHLVRQIEQNRNIAVLTSSHLKEVNGFIGNYTVFIAQGEQIFPHNVGVIIVATGAEILQPMDLYNYDGKHVISQFELEQMLKSEKLTAEKIVMIQCVGARNQQRNYCSKICCMTALKNAMLIKEMNPNASITILYRDIQTYGTYETYYTKAREMGILFIKYLKEREPVVKDKMVTVYDEFMGEELVLTFDLLVLSTPLIANPDVVHLSQMLKIPIDENGFFLEAHVKLRPLEFSTDGIYLCGSVHYPVNVSETISQAYGAASRASIPMAKKKIRSEAITAHVNEEACIGCGLCVSICPYNAAEFVRIPDNKWVSKINTILCKGCGACAVICPKMAIEMYHFKKEQILAQIRSSFSSTSEEEFEPKIIVFTCNWCSYAGADLAGVSRIQYPPNVRLIRLMCSGRIDPIFIFEALSNGADGVLLTGCHPGECHYISGNLWAEARYEMLKVWIEEIGMEPARLRLAWISASEGSKFAQVIKDMVLDMKKLGPNPLTKSRLIKEV